MEPTCILLCVFSFSLITPHTIFLLQFSPSTMSRGATKLSPLNVRCTLSR